MNKKNILYVSFIVSCVFIAIVVGLFTRNSIKKIEFEDVLNDSESFEYSINGVMELYNGIYFDDKDMNTDKLISNSEVVVKVKCTEDREIQSGAVLTLVEVIETYKGAIHEQNIYIYEPIDIYVGKNNIKNVTLPLGCNLMKAGSEYVLSLRYFKAPENYKRTEKEKVAYIYTNPIWSKLPMEVDENDYALVEQIEGTHSYLKIKHYEQIFMNTKERDSFFNIRKEIMIRYVNKE